MAGNLAGTREMPHPACRRNVPKQERQRGGFADDYSHCPVQAACNPRCRESSRAVPRLGAEIPGLAGLVRKYYLFDAESRTGGGCYLWESREAAERVYNAEWRQMITDRYGAPPEISFFETPVVVDNSLGKTILDAAE
jgi:hypothetical protein